MNTLLVKALWVLVGRLLNDEVLRNAILNSVKDLESTSLTGEQRRQKLLTDLEFVARGAGDVLINLTIEAAIIYVRSKVG